MITYMTAVGLRGKTCTNCGKHPAWGWFQTGVIDFVHGGASPWCERCVVEAQLTHAREVVPRIEALEARLIELTAEKLPPEPTAKAEEKIP